MYAINIFQRPFFNLGDREMKESTLSHFVIDINKISNPSTIYCFLLHRWVHICLESAFMVLLLFLFTFRVSGHFLDWRCNPNVASGDQTAAHKETAACRMNCSQYRQVASHIFILLMIVYCLLQLLLRSVMIRRVSFVRLLFWMCVGFGFG